MLEMAPDGNGSSSGHSVGHMKGNLLFSGARPDSQLWLHVLFQAWSEGSAEDIKLHMSAM